jgi:hypothetical protein
VRSRRRLAAICVVAIAGLAAAAPSALGANGNASCVGLGSSALASGQGEEFSGPGARTDVSQAVKAIADALGVSPGALVSALAHEHGGSAEACFPNGPPST